MVKDHHGRVPEMSPQADLIHLHQRCGYSDSPFARIYFFYTAGSRKYTFPILQDPETDFREWKRCVPTQKNIKPYQKDTFFL